MAKIVTVKPIIAVVASHGWHIFQMDVHNAFLQGDLIEEVYITVPSGFSTQAARQGEMFACRLHKSLYGITQASKQWNLKLTQPLQQLGFIQSHYDYSCFRKQDGPKLLLVLIYVDDLLITGNDLDLITQARMDLQKCFQDEGPTRAKGLS